MLTSDETITLERLGYLECIDHPAVWVEEVRTYGVEDIMYFGQITLLCKSQIKRHLHCCICGAIYNESIFKWEYGSKYHEFSEQYLPKGTLDFIRHKLRCITALELMTFEAINV